jgi:hypothetical protein
MVLKPTESFILDVTNDTFLADKPTADVTEPMFRGTVVDKTMVSFTRRSFKATMEYSKTVVA